MACDVAAAQAIMPPLQANFPRQRLVRNLTDARDLKVERIECEQMRPLLGRRKQRRDKPILVRCTHQRLAMRVVVLTPPRRVHGTPISKAATRRRSPSRML